MSPNEILEALHWYFVVLGNYGLISIEPWESDKTIIKPVSQEMITRNLVGEQCLRYYYYFTVYDKLDWGQHILVLIKSDKETNNKIEIDRLSAVDMIENRWYSRNKTFNSASNNYTVIFFYNW